MFCTQKNHPRRMVLNSAIKPHPNDRATAFALEVSYLSLRWHYPVQVLRLVTRSVTISAVFARPPFSTRLFRFHSYDLSITISYSKCFAKGISEDEILHCNNEEGLAVGDEIFTLFIDNI